MTRRFVAFDLETAKILEDSPGDLLDHRPLGVTCAVAVASDEPSPVVWHGRNASGETTPRLTRDEATSLVERLEAFVADGYTLVTWNGLGFDFAVLADESGLIDRCTQLAERNVDMLFHAFCLNGHYISLQSAADGMRVAGKKEGVSGAMAPALWAAGRHEEVIEYCIQDTRATLAVATAAEAARRLDWNSRNGDRRSISLPGGWLTAIEARALPLPDTSWMRKPAARSDFYRWFPGGEPR